MIRDSYLFVGGYAHGRRLTLSRDANGDPPKRIYYFNELIVPVVPFSGGALPPMEMALYQRQGVALPATGGTVWQYVMVPDHEAANLPELTE